VPTGGALHRETLRQPFELAPQSQLRARPRRSFYLWIALAMCATVVFGFWFTYFGPLFSATYPPVRPIVHVHGWSYFLWYVLFATQAALIRSGRTSTHRTLGVASTALATVTIAVGLIVSTVRVEEALGPDGDPFWKLMGLPIFSIWILFTAFCIAAFRRRRHAPDHKRLMLLASSVALAAATFRIVVQFLGLEWWTAIVGTMTPILFIVAAVIHDYRSTRSVHRIYAWGLPVTAGVIGGTFLLGLMPEVAFLEQAVGSIGRQLKPLY
jgi:hypothetical protein